MGGVEDKAKKKKKKSIKWGEAGPEKKKKKKKEVVLLAGGCGAGEGQGYMSKYFWVLSEADHKYFGRVWEKEWNNLPSFKGCVEKKLRGGKSESERTKKIAVIQARNGFGLVYF